MNYIVIPIVWLARFYIIYESFVNLIGILWFSTSLEVGVIVSGSISAIAGLAAGFMPRRIMRKSSLCQHGVILLCVIVIGSQLYLIGNDLFSVAEPNIDNVTKRALYILALVVVIIETIALKRSNTDSGGLRTRS